MADCGSLQSPTSRYIKPISSIFFNNCPKLFTGVTPDSQLLMSPTSILDAIPFSGFKNPFSSESNTPKSNPEPDHNRRLWSNLEPNSNKVGLSILESLEQDSKCSKQSKPETRMVLFGSQLKIQIPLHPYGDFGIKTRTCRVNVSQNAHKDEVINKVKSRGVFSNCLSPIDMETSEDYTCVITHGPNPKTTHIYNNCIVQSCCGAARSLSLATSAGTQTDQHHRLPDDFLSHCYTCRKDLSVGEDIYMYKGEKAFCSSECRYEEMRLDEANSDY